VNDAPALALADVSVAMGEGAALAMETADCTLLDCNLNKLLYILRMGRRATRTIIENVVFSLVVKALVMGFMFVGKATLWAAIASDVGAMLIVTINGMKLLPSSRKVQQNDLAVQESAKELTSV
jgi:Cd2+/Zn2+-exporting ATPase